MNEPLHHQDSYPEPEPYQVRTGIPQIFLWIGAIIIFAVIERIACNWCIWCFNWDGLFTWLQAVIESLLFIIAWILTTVWSIIVGIVDWATV